MSRQRGIIPKARIDEQAVILILRREKHGQCVGKTRYSNFIKKVFPLPIQKKRLINKHA